MNEKIIKTIKELLGNKKMTTYMIAKELNVSWSTANTWMYKLKCDTNITDSRTEFNSVGSGKRVLWWLK